MPKISPERARARAEKNKVQCRVKYQSQTPCKRGHVGERYTMTGECCTCAVARRRVRYLASKGAEGEAVEEMRVEFVPDAPGPVTWGGPYVHLMEAGWRD